MSGMLDLRLLLSMACMGLVIAGSALCGFVIAKNYADRPRQLLSVRAGVEMLMTEIVYAATPLSEACIGVSKSQGKPVADFFATVGRGLADMMTVNEAWARGLEELRLSSSLLLPDLEVLRTLGEVVGVSNREDQERHLLIACQRLHALHTLAMDEASRNVRMWRYLGFLIGVVVVIIIL